MWVQKSYSELWSRNQELKSSNHILIPKYLTMPKPLVKNSREKIDKEFFIQRIKDISIFAQKRRDTRIFFTFCIWLQAGCPENLKELRDLSKSVDNVSQKVSIKELGNCLDKVDEKINWQFLPLNVLEFYSVDKSKTKDYLSAQYVRINSYMANLLIQLLIQLRSPLDPAWDFLEDIFIIPQSILGCNCNSELKDHLWTVERFENLNTGSLSIIKQIYDMFNYFSENFSGIQEHYLRMSATLFWCTRTEPVYSLELYTLLQEMFGEHKLNSRSSQLCDKCLENKLICCQKKVGSKNRSSIYFMLAPGAEWIIASLFPDENLIIQQQAVAVSFLRYSKQILTQPWTIDPLNFNYLMDVWFKSFLYSDNFDQIVYEKALELRRNIPF